MKTFLDIFNELSVNLVETYSYEDPIKAPIVLNKHIFDIALAENLSRESVPRSYNIPIREFKLFTMAGDFQFKRDELSDLEKQLEDIKTKIKAIKDVR